MIFRRIFVFLIISFLLAAASFALPSRIISTMPSITETLFILGVGDKVVGVTTNCNYPKEAATKEKIGRVTVNVEKIFYLKPDLILMLEDAQLRDIEYLKSKKLPVVAIQANTVQGVFDSINQIGSLTGATKEAEKIVMQLNSRLHKIKESDKAKIAKSIFVMAGFKPLVSVGRSSFINDILAKAGGENVIISKVAYPQISFEELYRLNPDILIVPKGLFGGDQIKKEEKLRRLSAVQNDRILFVEDDLLFRPGPRVVDAIEIIAKFLSNEN
ncbi:hypothetical protein A3J90_01565 [candidate division WOR-1 bacterium RIFOXYC2_FULL_37_10]|uniref:Fe/B12 periplasmic-binding domain-containing protein n=1 Tax=candidate division WOR-1 bacterium RIFOXYB2_FULL_37_13 TaxID=1802579 RepID=A0A1F4SPM6_UNCSA|nr:MAG: hypothetical protein A2246_05805 [candidate division WOR-1 bacterium RIFOXYA2_FULL_37_7]OGC22360.1 MAG: hypothetical protein A2310_01675 [candidate division WOR-1 bacterium RIFOXYB2_FULL_37_13]OGC35798.1 MAG: hypothetical protein A3J90_01565 [candidate division WOR-1 bacterium RIFOXYC2_FULL_37_10]